MGQKTDLAAVSRAAEDAQTTTQDAPTGVEPQAESTGEFVTGSARRKKRDLPERRLVSRRCPGCGHEQFFKTRQPFDVVCAECGAQYHVDPDKPQRNWKAVVIVVTVAILVAVSAAVLYLVRRLIA